MSLKSLQTQIINYEGTNLNDGLFHRWLYGCPGPSVLPSVRLFHSSTRKHRKNCWLFSEEEVINMESKLLTFSFPWWVGWYNYNTLVVNNCLNLIYKYVIVIYCTPQKEGSLPGGFYFFEVVRRLLISRWSTGRKEGKKEGRKERKKEGRKEGRKGKKRRRKICSS